MKDGIGILEISFVEIGENNNPEIKSKIIPDNIPKIKMLVLQTLYSREEPKEINGSLIESTENEGVYLYKVQKYLNKEEVFYVEDDEPFRQSMFIEINYEINNEEYISIFAINTKESKD